MNAPKNAIPIEEENPAEAKAPTLNYTCSCGHKGNVKELLCVEDSDTLWCPVCRTADWTWD